MMAKTMEVASMLTLPTRKVREVEKVRRVRKVVKVRAEVKEEVVEVLHHPIRRSQPFFVLSI